MEKRINKIARSIISADEMRSKVVKVVDAICTSMKVPTIKVKFTNKKFSKGLAYYSTEKYKGTKKNIPLYITIGNWEGIRDYSDEVSYVVSHELAHHIRNMLNNSLRHDGKFRSLWASLEKKFNAKLRVKQKVKKTPEQLEEIEFLKEKIEYWKENGDEINRERSTTSLGEVDVAKEIKIMQNKLKKMLK